MSLNKSSFRWNSISRALLVGVAVLLAGCAGVLPSHVEPKGGLRGFTPANCASDYDAGLCQASEYSDKWVSELSEASANPALFRDLIAALTLPAVGAAGFYGITGHGSADRISRLTLGAATLYGAGTYFAGKPKQEVYFEGVRAMSCAQMAVFPAFVKKERTTALNDALAVLSQELPAASAYIDLTPDEATSIADAKSMYQAGLDFQEFVEFAGVRLKTQLNVIGMQVNRLLLDQTPDLASLQSIASGLVQHAQSLQYKAADGVSGNTTGVGAQAAPSPEDQAAAQRALDRQTRLDEIRKQAEIIRPIVATLAARQNAVGKLNECSPVGAPTTFVVTPSNPSLSLVEGGSVELSIVDSTGFPSVNVAGAGVSAEPLIVRGESLVLTVRGIKATGGSGATVTIRSASGMKVHSVEVIVAAKAPDAPPPQNKPDEEPAKPKNDLEREFFKDPTNVLLLQCALGLKGSETDCLLGERTRKKISEVRGDGIDQVNQKLIDDANKQIVKTACEDPKIAECEGE